jgi:peptidoglycan/LPS O-acetylase OafA/YrhL
MRRIAELDGLRGAAAVLIVAYHLFIDYLPGCWAAVDVFFVLSGFLITNILLRHELSCGFLVAFYARRGLRIWPIYYLLIMALVVSRLHVPSTLPYYLTYTQQLPLYWGGRMPAWLPMQHAWTLALEEQFYLIWPVLVFLVGRRSTPLLALIVAGAAIVLRMTGFSWWILAGRCDGFALGGLLAAIVANRDTLTARRQIAKCAFGLAGFAVVLMVILAANGRLFSNGGYITVGMRTTVASCGSFALVAAVLYHAGHPLLAFLRMRVIVYLGTISYGIYLYHHPIIQMSHPLGRLLGLAPGPALWGTECALTLFLAVLSWHLIERPILRLKDRVPYQRDPASDPGHPSRQPGYPPLDALSPSVA